MLPFRICHFKISRSELVEILNFLDDSMTLKCFLNVLNILILLQQQPWRWRRHRWRGSARKPWGIRTELSRSGWQSERSRRSPEMPRRQKTRRKKERRRNHISKTNLFSIDKNGLFIFQNAINKIYNQLINKLLLFHLVVYSSVL